MTTPEKIAELRGLVEELESACTEFHAAKTKADDQTAYTEASIRLESANDALVDSMKRYISELVTAAERCAKLEAALRKIAAIPLHYGTVCVSDMHAIASEALKEQP